MQVLFGDLSFAQLTTPRSAASHFVRRLPPSSRTRTQYIVFISVLSYFWKSFGDAKFNSPRR